MTNSFIESFLCIQKECFHAMHVVMPEVKQGISEAQLAQYFHSELSRKNIDDFWYPTLVCAGEYSGQPLTRRNHLPSQDVKLRQDDIVILDITPFHASDKTTWGNWSITCYVGADPFYKKLCDDLFTITIETAFALMRSDYHDLCEVYDQGMQRASEYSLENIDHRGNIGHSIFQVPAGQTVDQTSEGSRLFIDACHQALPKQVLISIEPEMGRINPADGIRYGGKFQFIAPIGYGEKGNELISLQLDFYRRMAQQTENERMLSLIRNIEEFRR